MDEVKVTTIEALRKKLDKLHNEIMFLKAKLAMANGTFLSLIGRSSDSIVILNQKHQVMYANYAAIELFDLNIVDLLGKPMELLVKENTVTEIQIPHSNGRTSFAEASVTRTEWNNEPAFIVNFHDITKRKETEQKLIHQSYHDNLTDLPNRIYFEKQISKSILEAKKNAEYLAVLYVDIDNFKVINDSLGHEAGDMLLKKVAGSLRRSIRETDFIARLGGDEFVVLITGVHNLNDIPKLAKKILQSLSISFHLSKKKFFINASIGIATYPLDGNTATELIRKADIAMYAAKRSGKNQYRYFSQYPEEFNQKILKGLQVALSNQELIMNYQPIINLKTSECFGYEALLRWKHPELGLLQPSEFLPIAEKLGIMSLIDDWVMQQSFHDYNLLNKDSLFLSLNLSFPELNNRQIVKKFLSYLEQYKIQKNHVILELCEKNMMDQAKDYIKKLNTFVGMGMKIAIDDYGTGYSTLHYIKKLPVSIIKIDKFFINGIQMGSDNAKIVESTINLAHSLGMEVVAEGVEQEEELSSLKKMNCDYAQGNLLAQSMFIDELKQFILA